MHFHLREEGDYIERGSALSGWRFLSTPSARRATKAARLTSRATRISIHALREEGDAGSGDQGIGLGISIHALREEGDQGGCPERVRDFISIHALREEGDWIAEAALLPVSNFYPRPPRGGRHGTTHEFAQRFDISIHALREEGDRFDA